MIKFLATLLATIEAWFKKIEPKAQQVITTAVNDVNLIKTYLFNPTAESIIEAVTGGKISESLLNTVNAFLTKVLKGLTTAEGLANASSSPATMFTYLAGLFKEADPELQASALMRLPVTLAKSDSSTANIAPAAIASIQQGQYAHVINVEAETNTAEAKPAQQTAGETKS